MRNLKKGDFLVKGWVADRISECELGFTENNGRTQRFGEFDDERNNDYLEIGRFRRK